MATETVVCRVCKSSANPIFKAKLLSKYTVQYHECHICGTVQVEDPYWLTEAYTSAINSEDTGILVRNTDLADKISIILLSLFGKDGKYLDYAGGYGIFTRLMRDIGFDFYWYDPYADNLLARGFEYKNEDEYTALTILEAFEHFVDPKKELGEMLQKTNTIIFTTLLLPDSTPKPDDWWYYLTNTGQHITFYRTTSFQYLAQQFGLNYYSDGTVLHILTKKNFIPKVIENSQFNKLLKSLKGDYTQIIRNAYKKKKLKTEALGLKNRFSNHLLDIISNPYYELNSNENDMIKTNILKVIENSIFLKVQIESLLTMPLRNPFLHYKWKRILTNELKSKTFSDMLLIQEKKNKNMFV